LQNQGTYLANSPLVGQIAFAHSGATLMTATKTYDNLNRLTGIVNGNGTVPPVDRRGYAYDSANQRTGMTNVDGSYWVYQYDALGQVTNGVKRWPDNTVVAGQQFGYGFDTIGNRMTTLAGGDANGANRRLANYAANSLNQYTSRTVPGAVDVIGSATNTAAVWVDQYATYRKSNYFWLALPVTNTSGPVYQTVTTLAALSNGYGSNAEYGTTNIGHEFLPQTPENYTYDADGNLLSDGRWTYTWDAENRLVGMASLSNAPTASRYQLAFAYDYQGRRVQKTVSTWSGSGYIGEYTNRFVYDGWNVSAILNASASIAASFMWGTDLSGSMQGAGGVGGLLAENVAGNGVQFAAYDGNGNLAALVSASSGAVTANYEYGPFGEVIRATGPMAKANPFRFSTKYQDDETGLLYYGYRYYNPSTGRWLSRDPKGEAGFEAIRANKSSELASGANPYLFVGNGSVSKCDSFGLQEVFPIHLPPDPPPPPEIANPSGHGRIIFDSGISGYLGVGGGGGSQTILYDNGQVVSYMYTQIGVGCGGKAGGFGCGEVVNVFKPSDYCGFFVNGSVGYGAGATVSTGFGGVCAYTAGGGVGGIGTTIQWYWIVSSSR
jgi:RHS repeat-associated protein